MSTPLERGAQAAALVTQMTISTVVGGFLGRRLDAWLQTEPWGMVTGFILGFSAGMLSMFRILLRRDDDDDPTHPA
ncbi:MAG TPA: AtpZ/AtpI family protein [Deltaproteobacteria bacterium]|nr:AtpZ/AtpI family protein [Deltaproteobacteria bacterium]